MPLQDLLGQIQSGGISGIVDEVTGQPADSNARKFRRRLTEADLVEDAKSIPTGEFTKLGDGFTVPAQEQYRWGFGAASAPDNQGYFYADIQQDAGAGAAEGLLRLEQRDAQERTTIVVFEERTEGLDGSLTDRQNQIALPEQRDFPKVGRDSILAVSMDPDSTFTIGTASGETVVLGPTTVYPV